MPSLERSEHPSGKAVVVNYQVRILVEDKLKAAMFMEAVREALDKFAIQAAQVCGVELIEDVELPATEVENREEV